LRPSRQRRGNDGQHSEDGDRANGSCGHDRVELRAPSPATPKLPHPDTPVNHHARFQPAPNALQHASWTNRHLIRSRGGR
jgi:hypothetical protein